MSLDEQTLSCYVNYFSWLAVVSYRNKYFLEQTAKLFLLISKANKNTGKGNTGKGKYAWSQDYLTETGN